MSSTAGCNIINNGFSGLVLLLLTSESSWITGQNIIIDGGRSLK